MAQTQGRRQGSHFASSQTQRQSATTGTGASGSGSAAATGSATSGSARHAAHAAGAQQAEASSAYVRQARAVSSQQAAQATQRTAAQARSATQPTVAQPTARRAQASRATGMTSVATPRTRAQRQAAARGGHSRGVPLIIGAGILVAIVAVLAIFVVPGLMGGSDSGSSQEDLPNQGSEVQVTIADGSGAVSIATQLEEAGVIADTEEFVSELQRQKADSSLKSGAYTFTVGQDYDSIISRLTSGPNGTRSLTIPEGLTVAQTAEKVEEGLAISSDVFIEQAKASNYVADYAFLADAAASSYDSLEGYLYPKTYEFSISGEVSADTVIRTMLDQYVIEVESLDFSSAEASLKERYGVDMSSYDIIKLASIVEREAVTDEQRANISSTFYNRLEIGMALQSDATYMYVTGGEVTYDDLLNDQDNPYNTRYNTGLTPTPICSPSLASINATLYPNETDYLYFYITSDTEQFSSTYDEHLSAQN